MKTLKRRYYEVFGDLEAAVEFLKLLTVSLIVILFLTLLGAFVLAKRPPLVIRVTEVGSAEAITRLKSESEATEVEILDFARTFAQNYVGYSSFTLARDQAEAFNRMTRRFQKKARHSLLDSGLLSRIREAELGSDIGFKEVKLTKNSPDYAEVSLIGVRTITSYKDPNYRESNLFHAELLIKKVPRTKQVPWGLLVESYHELILNKLKEE